MSSRALTTPRSWTQLAALAAAVAAMLCLAAPASAADSQLTSDTTTGQPAAYGGIVAWSRQSGTRFKLVVANLATGHVTDADAPSSKAFFDPDVGPDSHGNPIVVWSRCKHSDRDCDIWRYRITSQKASEVGSVSLASYNEYEPVEWKNRYVFRRCKLDNTGCRGRTRNGDSHTRSVTKVGSMNTDIGDLRGSRLLFSYTTGSLGATSYVRTVKVGSVSPPDPCTVARGHLSGDTGDAVFAPKFDGPRAYWTHQQLFGAGGPDDETRTYRTEIGNPCTADEQVARRETAASFAVTGSEVIYQPASGGIYRADDPPVTFAAP